MKNHICTSLYEWSATVEGNDMKLIKIVVLAAFTIFSTAAFCTEFCHDSAAGYWCIEYPPESYCQRITDENVDTSRKYLLKKGQKKSDKRERKISKKHVAALNRGKEDALKEAACNDMEDKGLWEWTASSWVHPPVLTTDLFHMISALRKKKGIPMGPYIISDKK